MLMSEEAPKFEIGALIGDAHMELYPIWSEGIAYNGDAGGHADSHRIELVWLSSSAEPAACAFALAANIDLMRSAL